MLHTNDSLGAPPPRRGTMARTAWISLAALLLAPITIGASACGAEFHVGGSGGSGGGDVTSAGGSGTTDVSVSTGTAGGGGTGGAASCTKDGDCPPSDNPCAVAICIDGACGTSNVEAGKATATQTAGDCLTAVCDGNGGVTSEPDDGDVPADPNECAIFGCSEGSATVTPEMVGVPCSVGGTVCDGEGVCVECNGPSDCASQICDTHKCVDASCADGVHNGDETDKDCGGSCGPCDDGAVCQMDGDCKSLVCQKVCLPPTCSDGVKNGDEGDVDCGAACPAKCSAGATCGSDDDCKGGKCEGGTCSPTCSDGEKNGGESDVDCGGPGCDKCPAGKTCGVPLDCQSGICNSGVCGCPQGQTLCGNTCVNTGSDSNHCGACGHSCLGGTCAGGACQPITLAGGANAPAGLVIDATDVYWTNETGGNVKKVSNAGGGNVNTIAAGLTNPRGIAMEAGSIFVTTGNGIVVKMAKDGSNPIAIVNLGALPLRGIAVLAQTLVFTSPTNGTVYYAGLDGSNLGKLSAAIGPSPNLIAADLSRAFWTDTSAGLGSVQKYQLGGGGGQSALASMQNGPAGIAVDANNVYWANENGGTVSKVPIGGGNAALMMSGLSAPHGVAVDATHVYWTNSGNGTVMKLSKLGGQPITLASGQSTPKAIAVDGLAVYWLNNTGGTVMKVAK